MQWFIILYIVFCFDFIYKAFTPPVGTGAGFQDANICPLGMGLDLILSRQLFNSSISVSKSPFLQKDL